MCNLISSELFKIMRSKVTYTIGMIFVALAIFQTVVVKIAVSMGKVMVSPTGIDGFVSPLNGDLSYIVIGIFVTIIMCQDFSTGSIRQIIGKGTSRVKYVFAKFIAMVIVISVLMAGYSVVCFLGCSLIGEVGELASEVMKHLLVYVTGACCMILGYTAITEFVCILFKKNTITIPVNLLFIFVGGVVSQLGFQLTENELFYKYWIANMSASFASFEIGYADKLLYMEIFIVIASVFIWWSVFVFKRRDID